MTRMFPDVETALCDLIEAAGLVGAGHTGTATPANLGDRLPFVRVNRYGGPDDGVTDGAAVDVESFAATRGQAFQLARQVHHFLIDQRHGGPVLIDEVRTSVGVAERPWANGNIRRFGGSYDVRSRRSA